MVFSQGEGGAPGLPGIAGPRGGPVSGKDIFNILLTPRRSLSCFSSFAPGPLSLLLDSILKIYEIQENI